MKTISLTSIALLSLLAVGAAHAGDVIVPASIVKYGDLDLTRSTGEETLYRRIHQAARTNHGRPARRPDHPTSSRTRIADHLWRLTHRRHPEPHTTMTDRAEGPATPQRALRRSAAGTK